MTQNSNRPLSPHIDVYRWAPQMLISIMHRATGFVLATVGLITLLWWLSSIAAGPESYAMFQTYAVFAGDTPTTWQMASNWFFRLVAIGVTFSFFQHLFSGLRHLVMDIGAGYELQGNRTWTFAVFIAAFFATGSCALFVAQRYIGI